MGCMKGFEQACNGEVGYGRKIVRADLRKPPVELCPVRVNYFELEAQLERTGTVRVWTGWPAFDVRICKFEMDQWLDACNFNFISGVAGAVIESAEGVIEAVAKIRKKEMVQM